MLQPLKEIGDLYSPEYWVARISASVKKAVEGILETGRLLIEAKDHLRHGDFTKMIESQLPFGPRMAQKYMKIATHKVLSDPKHASLLPPAVDTLDAMARLDKPLLLEKINDGSINPKLMRKDVARLKGEKEEKA